MLNWFIRNRIDAFSRQWNYDMTYALKLLDANRAALFAFDKATRIARFRDQLPKDEWHAARLVGTLHEDCGACAQLVIQMAQADGVGAPLLAAVVRGESAQLPEGVRLVVAFCRATLHRDLEASDLRPQIVERFGERGLAALALTLAGARLFPTVKYVLGQGHACHALSVGELTVAPRLMAAS